ncbi:MAG: sodium:calcium antiporter, partial [Alphaproteobacteria bacterium]|nr:sodium:calcium antiporter [Alphaproteobacteria bacterium]
MTEIIIYAVLGLGGLLVGGSILIPGVVSLARQMGLPAVVVTVIVIAGGTSTPELIVSVDAALVGSPGIVWGNL